MENKGGWRVKEKEEGVENKGGRRVWKIKGGEGGCGK